MPPAAGKNAGPKQTLNLALIAPLVSPIAPPFLGGAQAVINDLAQGLARRGHAVTLFAASGSALDAFDSAGRGGRLRIVEIAVQPGELKAIDFSAASDAPNTVADAAFFRQSELFLQIYLMINSRETEFQIAHAHAFDWPAFALAPLSRVPAVHTVHLPSFDSRINALLKTTCRQTGSSGAVTVSKACAATYAKDFSFDRVIYNGIDTAPIPFGKQGHGYLLFAGRMSPDKGPDLAIALARRAGRRLVLAGGIYNQEYFQSRIAPELSKGNLDYRGPLQRAELYRLMSGADGLLFPSRLEEAFGLILVEALAAGTPVIGWARGAVPEIIEHGRHGFLLPYLDMDGAAEAIGKLPQISREECRKRVAERFSLASMLEQYENYYLEVIAGCRER
jgi:UDP-glucose:tetrahydrobiopterin glucosyltransferase